QFDSTGDRLVFALLASVRQRRGTAGRAGRARRSRHGVAMDPATGSLRAALIVSDMFLMPVPPRSSDIWAVELVGKLVREAREAINPGLRACIFLNSAEPRAVRPGNGTTFALANETSHRQLARGRDLHPAARG